MGKLIPKVNMKIMFMAIGDHRIFCEAHKPRDFYEVEVSNEANCWACLREIKTFA